MQNIPRSANKIDGVITVEGFLNETLGDQFNENFQVDEWPNVEILPNIEGTYTLAKMAAPYVVDGIVEFSDVTKWYEKKAASCANSYGKNDAATFAKALNDMWFLAKNDKLEREAIMESAQKDVDNVNDPLNKDE